MLKLIPPVARVRLRGLMVTLKSPSLEAEKVGTVRVVTPDQEKEALVAEKVVTGGLPARARV